MGKIKYTRKEYREEYLRSDEWKKIRDSIMSSNPDCQCCKEKKASDLHHMVYRHIVDIKVTELLPVCRECHSYIHQAINDNYISQDIKDIEEIRIKTINLRKDEGYKSFRKWLTSKHHLTEEEIKNIQNGPPFLIKKISGFLRKNVWYEDLGDRKFTGRQILIIRQLINRVEKSKKRQEEYRGQILKRRTKKDKSKYRKLNEEEIKGFYSLSKRNKRKFWLAGRRIKDLENLPNEKFSPKQINRLKVLIDLEKIRKEK